MAGETENNVFPLPNVYFSVQLGEDASASFAQVDGLEVETRVLEYRHGNSPVFYPIKMPGLGRVGNVTLRKGVFVDDAKFWDWFNETRLNTIRRRTVVINLLDEAGVPRRVYTLNNAWPTKIVGPDLRAVGGEVAVEAIVLAFETMVVSAP
jgi:phage tail-like protein